MVMQKQNYFEGMNAVAVDCGGKDHLAVVVFLNSI